MLNADKSNGRFAPIREEVYRERRFFRDTQTVLEGLRTARYQRMTEEQRIALRAFVGLSEAEFEAARAAWQAESLLRGDAAGPPTAGNGNAEGGPNGNDR
jgi:hypothetical protein